jgi:hypothetical protein
MTTEHLDPHSLQPGEVNLSSWTVHFDKTLLGWKWAATHADGREVGRQFPEPILFANRHSAEMDAVKRLSAIERGDWSEEVSGFDLQIRVRERDRT